MPIWIISLIVGLISLILSTIANFDLIVRLSLIYFFWSSRYLLIFLFFLSIIWFFASIALIVCSPIYF